MVIFPTKVPRIFILVGFVLAILVLGPNYYLYGDDAYYPSSSSSFIPQPGPKGAGSSHATSPEEPVVLVEKPLTNEDEAAVVPSSSHGAPGKGAGSGGEPAAVAAAMAAAVEPSTTVSVTPVATPVQLLQSGDDEDDDSPNPILEPGECPQLGFLQRVHAQHQLSSKVRYKKICIEPIFAANVDRNAIAEVSETLLAGEVTIDMDRCNEARLPKCTPVKLNVPKPYAKHDVSHLIFGISTGYERLQDSVDSFVHWLSRHSGNGAKLIALVTDYQSRKKGDIQRLQQKFQSAGANVMLVRPINDSYSTSQSHFAVLAHMLNNSSPQTQWFGLLDDDTFFPRGLKPLSDALAALDHSQDYYVGALSEDFRAVQTFGFMAFGGAGAYLSAPLARTLGSQLHRCIEEATGIEGDIIIRDCVYSNSKAKLTILPGLYQQDMKEDASGFFESGVQAINFHHWKSWYKEPVIQMATTSLYCGDCFLQRWRFGSDSIFTNGYSIVKYLYDTDYLDLDRMEGTWSNANRDFDFSVGPLRRKLVPDEKKSYRLKDIDFGDHGEFRQLYVWEGNPEAMEPDGVIEVVWES